MDGGLNVRVDAVPVELWIAIDEVCRLGYEAFFLGDGELRPVSALDPARYGYIFNFIFKPAEPPAGSSCVTPSALT